MKKRRDGQRGIDDLKRLIQEAYPSLSGNQRKVADYLLQHPREVPFLSIVELERKSGASKATIVRLAQRLGFSGFLELRSNLLDGVQSLLQTSEEFPLLARGEGGDTLSVVAHQDVKNINQTMAHIDRKTFREVARLVLGASHVYTVGLGISSLMSQILAYSLNQVAVKATAFVHDYETFFEQLPFVSSSDLLVVFSFPPYSKDTIDVAREAAYRKVPIIAITDRITSPLGVYAVQVLPIRSQNLLFTNSFSAISVIINALATEVAVRNKTRAVKLQQETDRMLNEAGHFTPG